MPQPSATLSRYQEELPDVATQVDTANRLGHRLGDISAHTLSPAFAKPALSPQVAQTPVHFPSALADGHGAQALIQDGEIHLGTPVLNYSQSQSEGILAHETAHRIQQLEGRRQGERADIELEAGDLATGLLAGRSTPPNLSLDAGTAYFDTPQDKLVVERAKKRLALLKTFLTEWEAREVRRLHTDVDRDPLSKKRTKMDEDIPGPRGQREIIEKENIAKLNRLPLNVEISEQEVKFKVKFHVRFEDPKLKSRFGELKSSMLEGIRMIWDQRLKGAVFSGRRFTVEPEFTLISETSARDQNFWLITVRPTDTAPVVYPGCNLPQPGGSIPTSVTEPSCDGGVMSIPPLHIGMPDVLGHELLHLFGLVDRYMSFMTQGPGKKTSVSTLPSRETGGRPDPLGAEKGTILAEDLAFLFDRLGVYAMEEGRGLDVLRKLEREGMSIEMVRAEIYRQEEIIQTGRDPDSLIRIREDFRDKVIRDEQGL